MNSKPKLSTPLEITPHIKLNNRIVKSALSEGLAEPDGRPSKSLIQLYQTWANSGAGLIITGNVMIDSRAIGEPGNVVIEDEKHIELIQRWVTVAKSGGSQVWMQINHPGKQAIKGLNKETVSPSAVPFNKKMAPFFATPRELTTNEILDLIQRYANTAEIAKKAGFDGIQLHGAHGYLISQFLSPHHNRRTDEWGGTNEKRRRFVLEVYNAIRSRVGTDFPVAIKINSADFQRGGFTEEESLETILTLEKVGIDLIEISGGTYEKPVMQLGNPKASTIAREAYFLEFAKKVRMNSQVKLMVTGGFRSFTGMEDTLKAEQLDLIGLGRIFIIEPLAGQRLLNGLETQYQVKPLTTGIKFIDSLGVLEVTWYTRQMSRIGRGEKPRPNESGLKSFLLDLKDKGFEILKKRRLRAS
ncbi:NADH:flavin oxidoreductase/NADH oxidase family protein [Acinetobacter sp. V91_7]|uniref:NADH:flavin oxidoreductase/NADH oxidase family protein n=1 Tax=unclassified Acinetobacter TaxID=196816 RepID=UPI00287CF0FB|nr:MULTISPECIES: NADH:flavin oxidoreductase/NADH oxidase family protein [unclassified Acinetobacter]MDS7927900.1 NADH:flavin oxidoreductase/NADH oxidase family protein [Acinetobacter sp. V102_4]MDS7932452.1 NADH:flavin oxidoreductase/NADH oxidase family protein [Acinetobacter sp. V91_4B]MDS7961419.1 NADH:flavin oxidoreductase/NADH oxidase family protein [Acinetobacter sp. V91_7]MDS8025880.1 NADH:flavin oxidoreductase/NADH oxidase family protein [Acinetobacter sp. V91_13]